MDTPARKKKKVDMVDSSMADNITAKKKVLTVKDMISYMNREGQKKDQSVTVKVIGVNHDLGEGWPNILTFANRGENKTNTVDIL